MLNVVALTGRLTADPEIKTTSSGTSVTSFRIAVDRAYSKSGEQRQADFIPIVAWRQTAEFICKYFTKGQVIAVQGSIQTRNYQDKVGHNRTAVEVLAEQVSFCGGKEEAKKQGKAEQVQHEDSQQHEDYLYSGYEDIDYEGDELPF